MIDSSWSNQPCVDCLWVYILFTLFWGFFQRTFFGGWGGGKTNRCDFKALNRGTEFTRETQLFTRETSAGGFVRHETSTFITCQLASPLLSTLHAWDSINLAEPSSNPGRGTFQHCSHTTGQPRQPHFLLGFPFTLTSLPPSPLFSRFC